MLRVVLRGPMQAEDSTGRSVLPKVRKTRALLAILCLAAPQPILRAQLIALLWSRREPDQARGSLRQALYELQTCLGPLGSCLLESDRFKVGLRAEGLEVVLGPGSPLEGGPAAHLFEDLQGIDPALDAFLAAERKKLSHRALAEAQEALTVAVDSASAVRAATDLIALDRGNERAWQALIRARLDQGDRSGAVACFEECRAALAETAQIAPSTATMALLNEARSESESASQEPAGYASSAGRGRQAERLRIGIARFRAGPGPVASGLGLGLEEELVLALSAFRWISCVPVAALEAFLDTSSSAPWHQLGLDLLLEGTAQERGANLRVSIRLLDLRTAGEVVWAGRFDSSADDPLAVQEQIAAEVAAQVEPKLQIWEGRKAVSRTGPHSSVRDLLSSAVLRMFSVDRAEFERAGADLERALRLDPANPTTTAWLTQWHLFALGQGWARDAAGSMRRARELARAALSLAPDDAHALTVAGHVQAYLDRDPDGAIRLLERAIEANPNAPMAWCRSAFAHSYAGLHEQALVRAERARQMSAGHPMAFLFEGAAAVPHLFVGDFEASIVAGARAIALKPDFSSSYKTQLAALGHAGRLAEAAELRERLLSLEPDFTLAEAIRRSPIRTPRDLALYKEGLRLAGLT